MVKARIPGSSQELYTVSVESMPQYENKCCKPGRVGKDLLCGVLIALAVICAAVAIFLIVYFVVNGSSSNELNTNSSNNETALDSSPLTRNKPNEEETKINALDGMSKVNDPLMTSTSLPDVGIHEPEFHVEGFPSYPPYKSNDKDTVPAPEPEPEPNRGDSVHPSTSEASIDSRKSSVVTEIPKENIRLIETDSRPETEERSEVREIDSNDPQPQSEESSVDKSNPSDSLEKQSSVNEPSADTSDPLVVGQDETRAQLDTFPENVQVDSSQFKPLIPENESNSTLENADQGIAEEKTDLPLNDNNNDTSIPSVIIDRSPWLPIHSEEIPDDITIDQQDAQNTSVIVEDMDQSAVKDKSAQDKITVPIVIEDAIVDSNGKDQLLKGDSPSMGDQSDKLNATQSAPEGRLILDVPVDIQTVTKDADKVDEKPSKVHLNQTESSMEESHAEAIHPNPSDDQQVNNNNTFIPSEIPVNPIEEETTDHEMPLSHDLGTMALLLPTLQNRGSTNAPNASAVEQNVKTGDINNTNEQLKQLESIELVPVQGQCVKRQLPFCKGVLPYSESRFPNWVGDNNDIERNLSVPYFKIIAESECNPRVQQYACVVLEPPCNNGQILPPCRKFCQAVAEDCKDYVLSALSLAQVLNCDQFPDSTDPNICINLASTAEEGECLPGEVRCADNSCIPERWVCNGNNDCSDGDDENSCGACSEEEFKCKLENRCIPLRWKCDNSRDCVDGSDEQDCRLTEECGAGQFSCQDGLSCIPLRRVCDGSFHCRDNSDEVNCTSFACQNDDFKCHQSGICIPHQWVCDNNWDCKDGSDELSCSSSVEVDDQNDDEQQFVDRNKNSTDIDNAPASNPEKCPLGQLLCMADKTCIRFEQLCDGTKDCADGADEIDCKSDI